MARVPRGICLGDVEAGDEEVLGLLTPDGLGATGGGTVALFMGGEYRAFRRPRIDFCGESSWCWTRVSQGLQIRGLPGILSWSSRRFSWLETTESASSLVISCSLSISTLAERLFTSAFLSVIVFTTSRASDSSRATSWTVRESSCFSGLRSAGVMVWVR